MFISQANNSEIPVFALRYLSYTASLVVLEGVAKTSDPECPECVEAFS